MLQSPPKLPLTPPPTVSRLGSPFTVRPSPQPVHKSPPRRRRQPIRRIRRNDKRVHVPPTPTPASSKSRRLHDNDQFSIQSTLHHAILNERLPWLPLLDLSFNHLDYQSASDNMGSDVQSIPVHPSELADLSIFDCVASEQSPLTLVETEDEDEEEAVISRSMITPQSALPIRGRRRTLFPTSTQHLDGPFTVDSPPSSAECCSSFVPSPPPRSPSPPSITKPSDVLPSDLPFAAKYLDSQESPRTPSPVPRKRRRIMRSPSPSPTRFASSCPKQRSATPPCVGETHDSVQALGSPYATPSPRFYNLMPVLAPYEDDDDDDLVLQADARADDAMNDCSDACSECCDESEDSEVEGVWPFGSPSRWLAPIFRSPLLRSRSRTPWTPHANHLPLPAFATPDA